MKNLLIKDFLCRAVAIVFINDFFKSFPKTFIIMSSDYFFKSDHSISEESLDLMHILENKTNLSQRQIAKEIGFSVGKVNYILKALLDIGFIKIVNCNKSNQKLKCAYILTPKGTQQKIIITKQYIAKKIQEYEKLKKYI